LSTEVVRNLRITADSVRAQLVTDWSHGWNVAKQVIQIKLVFGMRVPLSMATQC